ncbi:hypothetical protein EKO04_009083 [Ascochyta lentis]|uniref:Uncharacterized protein n=1 Tax=Ascochyta lentis TaxID=205686 RepID=A0A8H7MFK4_9PLEO|nr:hypothetical protein EKO04_009083 [Ascochyta lentis]
MKFFCQLSLTVVLAAVVLARVSTGAVSDLSTVINSTINGTDSGFGPHVKVYSYDDIMSAPEPVDSYANLSTLVTAGNGAEGTYTADIRMSGGDTKQHVAQISGQRMWDVLHKCLLEICPYERGRIGCYEDMLGAGVPEKDGKMKRSYYSRCVIDKIPYKTKKGGYATDASLTIKARAIFRNDKYPGMGAATYEMAAGVYARMTENKDNCYNVAFNDPSRPYQFCNVPRYVLVALPTTGPVTDSWLSMEVKFSGPTDHGTLDCSGSKRSVTGFWETAVRPDIAKIMGYPEDQWGTRTTCADNKDCFDVEKWRGCK